MSHNINIDYRDECVYLLRHDIVRYSYQGSYSLYVITRRFIKNHVDCTIPYLLPFLFLAEQTHYSFFFFFLINPAPPDISPFPLHAPLPISSWAASIPIQPCLTGSPVGIRSQPWSGDHPRNRSHRPA